MKPVSSFGRDWTRTVKLPKRISKRKAELESEGYQVPTNHSLQLCRFFHAQKHWPAVLAYSFRKTANLFHNEEDRARDHAAAVLEKSQQNVMPVIHSWPRNYGDCPTHSFVTHVSILNPEISCNPVQAWVTARAVSDFAKFAPVLEEWVALVREASALIDPSRPAYDVALEEFEKGMTSARLDEVFTQAGHPSRMTLNHPNHPLYSDAHHCSLRSRSAPREHNGCSLQSQVLSLIGRTCMPGKEKETCMHLSAWSLHSACHTRCKDMAAVSAFLDNICRMLMLL